MEPVMGDAGSCELLITSLDGRDIGEIVTDNMICSGKRSLLEV